MKLIPNVHENGQKLNMEIDINTYRTYYLYDSTQHNECSNSPLTFKFAQTRILNICKQGIEQNRTAQTISNTMFYEPKEEGAFTKRFFQ